MSPLVVIRLPVRIAPPLRASMNPPVVIAPVEMPVSALSRMPVLAVIDPVEIAPPDEAILTFVPAPRLPVVVVPPERTKIVDPAAIAPLVKVVPAAAWKLPVDTGPPMLIDPSVATGANGKTRLESKLSTPPAAMNIDASAR